MEARVGGLRSAIAPPQAVPRSHVMVEHGRERNDNYFWLREKSEPEVIAHLESENAYLQAAMQHTDALQERLVAEMRSHIVEQDVSVPWQIDDYFYYHRMEAGLQYPIYCRRHGSLTAPEQITLDVNVLAKTESARLGLGVEAAYVDVASVEYSPNHQLLAYAIDSSGEESYTVRVLDLQTGELLPDSMTGVSSEIVWGNDNQTIFSTVRNSEWRPYRVVSHQLGQPVTNDRVLFEELDDAFWVDISKTTSKRVMVISSGATNTTEQWLLDLNTAEANPTLVAPRRVGVRYYLDDHFDRLYVLTNDNAPNFRLMETDIDSLSASDWREVLPGRDDVTVSNLDVYRDFLVLTERKDGMDQLLVINSKSGKHHYIAMTEAIYSLSWVGHSNFDTDVVRYEMSSFVTPLTTLDYNVNSQEATIRKQQSVPGGYDSSLYECERMMAPARDGTAVPIVLVRRRDTPPVAVKPFLLYAYGAYGISEDADFNANRLSLLDRGFTCAIAHPRGGGELGEPWRKSGNVLNKGNTFTDFIDCAKHLIAKGYTTPGGLIARGGSAGGLLMGAIANMAPELFRAVIADVPFVDVITTMMDETIPLTTVEYEEWGDPRTREIYDYMLLYSPYDNVEAKAYPWMLVTAGLNDPRVAYWEPAKWVAKLRALKTDQNPLLLKMNMGKGHMGFTGRFDRLREYALQYAFMLDAVGLVS